MPKLFDDLRERLLRAGVASRHVRRYVAELQDHLEELRAQEGNEAAALVRLGGIEELAKRMLEKPEFRSWTARAPWAVFTVLPLVVLLAVILALGTVMFYLMNSYFVLGYHVSTLPKGVLNLGRTLEFLGTYALGPSAAAAWIALALRQRMPPVWPLIGLLAIGLFCGMFGTYAPLEPGEKGSFNVKPDYATGLAFIAIVALRASFLFAVSSAIYLTLRRRIMSRA